jgi:hypothetical protein
MEFLLYGLPKGETERYTEDLLAVRPTRQEAESVIERAKADGWHSFRIATFDGSPPDFVGAIRGIKRRK